LVGFSNLAGDDEEVAGRHRKPSTFRRDQYRGRHRKPPSRQLTVVPAVVAVAVLAVGGVAFGHAVADGQAPKNAVSLAGMPPAPRSILTPAAAATPIAPTTPMSPTSRPSPSDRATPSHSTIHRAPHRRVAVAAFTMTDRGAACYVQVRSSRGRLLVQRIVHNGQHVSIRQHRLRVVLGNAGAAWISIDGHRAHRAGGPGKVRQFRVH
jgi:Domain of unknown function (DUF4115)